MFGEPVELPEEARLHVDVLADGLDDHPGAGDGLPQVARDLDRRRTQRVELQHLLERLDLVGDERRGGPGLIL